MAKPKKVVTDEEKRFNKMWEDALLPLVGYRNFKKDRVDAAVRYLRFALDAFQPNNPDIEIKVMECVLINHVWQVLSAHLMDGYSSIIKEFERDFAENSITKSENQARLLLYTLLDLSLSTQNKNLVEATDLVTVILPRRLVDSMVSGLKALDFGEAQELFAVKASGRHKKPYSWDLYRQNACRHVCFLTGQGISKGKAQEIVCETTRISVETLRSWERELKKDPAAFVAFRAALEAGKTAASGCFKQGAIVKGTVLAALSELGGDGLETFAKAYRTRFGLRHLKQK